MEDLESRWNFPPPDLLNLLLQIKPVEQNPSIYTLPNQSFIYRLNNTRIIELGKIGWATDIILIAYF